MLKGMVITINPQQENEDFLNRTLKDINFKGKGTRLKQK